MKKLHLVFLWHMHQPYYKNDADGLYHMPWVYMHALKDYYELPAYHRKFKGIRATYNLVPSLLVQLEDYTSVEVNDTFIVLLRKKVTELSVEEKDVLISQLFLANVQHMITPLKRFRELYNKKSREDIFAEPNKLFDNQELLDLEVLYLLSWTGIFTRQEVPVVRELLEKGRYFTEEDKTKLVQALADFTGKVIPLYKELQEEGLIEVSATPFYHPILPLLIDLNSAKEAYPEIPMPGCQGNFEDDPAYHVREGLNEFEKQMGKRPNGMWPAEGSISEAAAMMFAENGVKWIASDEDVLANSIRTDLSNNDNRHLLYNRHVFEKDGKKINIFFRDKILSDLIGFTYSGWDAEDAANDFMLKLKKMHEKHDHSILVPVILDGENAWEFYPENGSLFFNKLYEKLEKAEWVQTHTMNEACSLEDVPESTHDRICAGSWIYGNFTTWLGHEEKNEAWKHLTAARKAFNNPANTQKIEDAKKELYIAEGSDWFWWYGDDHFSLQSDIFDKLFRNHLMNVYKNLGLTIPPELYLPIKRVRRPGLIRKPSFYIMPTIDGHITSFYEWLSAGEFDLKFDAGAMHASGDILKMLRFGFDRDYIYIAIEGDIRNIVNKDYTLTVEIIGTEEKHYNFKIKDHFKGENGAESAAAKVFEAKIPYVDIVENKTKIYMHFMLKKGNDIIEKAPLYNMIEVETYDDFVDDWMV